MSVEENIKIAVSTNGLTKTYSDLRDLDNLIDKINRTPIVVKVSVSGVNEAMKDLNRLSRKLNAMSKKTHNYRINGVHTTSSGSGGFGGGRNRPAATGGSGGGGRGRHGNLSGLFAHAVPVQFYNAINAIRFGAAAGARIGSVGGPVGAIAGAGIAAALATAVAGIHAHRMAMSMATSALTHSFQILSNGVVQFGSHLFNTIEETRRAEVSFASLASMHTGKSLAELRVSDPATYNAATEISRVISDRMRAISAETGQDFARVVGAAKSLIPDILDKMNRQGGSKNALIDNGEEVLRITEGFIRLGAVMRMSDPLGKNLSQQIFPLQEILAGTSGKGAAELFTSLRRRTGIKITGKDAAEIAAAVNSNNLSKALEILTKRMARAGVATTMISDLFEGTLTPNLDALKAQLTNLFTPLATPIYDAVLKMVKTLRINMLNMLQSEAIFGGGFGGANTMKARFGTFGRQIHESIVKEFFGSFITSSGVHVGQMDAFIKGFMTPSVMSNPLSSQYQIFEKIKSSVLAAIPALKEFANVVFQFFAGFAGQGFEGTFGNMVNSFKEIAPYANGFGQKLRSMIDEFIKALPAIVRFVDTLQTLYATFAWISFSFFRFADEIRAALSNLFDISWISNKLGLPFLNEKPEESRPWTNPYSDPRHSVYGGEISALSSQQAARMAQMAQMGLSMSAEARGIRFLAPPAANFSNQLPQNNRFIGRAQYTGKDLPTIPQNRVDIKSSPVIKNEFNMSVTPQINDMVNKLYDASRRGAEDGTRAANKDNKDSLNSTFSTAMAKLLAGMNGPASNAAPNP